MGCVLQGMLLPLLHPHPKTEAGINIHAFLSKSGQLWRAMQLQGSLNFWPKVIGLPWLFIFSPWTALTPFLTYSVCQVHSKCLLSEKSTVNIIIFRELLISHLCFKLILWIRQLKYKMKRTCLGWIVNYMLDIRAVIF